MVPDIWFEQMTYRLQGGCTTTVLIRHNGYWIQLYIKIHLIRVKWDLDAWASFFFVFVLFSDWEWSKKTPSLISFAKIYKIFFISILSEQAIPLNLALNSILLKPMVKFFTAVFDILKINSFELLKFFGSCNVKLSLFLTNMWGVSCESRHHW